MALVKAYLSVKDDRLRGEIFEDAVRLLIDSGKNRFHAKASAGMRNDHICLWVAKDDFFLLEEHVRSFENELFRPLPFTAYRGKIGISREFYSWDSHNGVQADLISRYLRMIRSEDEIDLLDMYSTYVKAWNGDLDEEHPFSQEYKRGNAQELLVLLESLNVMMGNDVIGDRHFLLNGDEDLWLALGEAKNWYEVAAHLGDRPAFSE